MAPSRTHHEVAKTRHTLLEDRTSAFCSAFLVLSDNPPDKLLDEHFAKQNPRITEHGPPWAQKRLPFLGKTFTGRDECLEYFKLLSETLDFIPDDQTFPDNEGIIVDENAVADKGDDHGGRGMASVVGNAKFKAVNTGKDWDEQFIWRLSGFDEDGKVGHWEIWADPLSAWVAVGGEKEE